MTRRPSGSRPCTTQTAPTCAADHRRLNGTIVGDAGRVNRERVAQVMRERGIIGLRLRRKVRTTIPEPNDIPVPDLLSRDFTAPVDAHVIPQACAHGIPQVVGP